MSRPSNRALLGGGILVAWLAGLGALAWREYLDPTRDRLAEAAARVSPVALFYSAMQSGRQIGYGSTVVDTTPTTIAVTELLRVQLPVGGRTQPAELRSRATLTRSLALEEFSLDLDAESGRVHTSGAWEGDSTFRFVVRTGAEPADTQRVHTVRPAYFPSGVGMALALFAPPAVGRELRLRVVDPVGLAVRQATVRFSAETLFVLHDSATFDSTAKRWREARPDTVRAWRLDPGAERVIVGGWVDAQGQLVRGTQLGTLELERRPYEVAVENWRIASPRAGAAVRPERDILETTAIAARRRVAEGVPLLRVRLGGVNLSRYALAGPRQELRGDTLIVRQESPAALRGDYALTGPGEMRRRFPRETSPEPLIESRDTAIMRAAIRAASGGASWSRGAPTPEEAARRLVAWVHDSLAKRVTFGVPSARQVLRTRSGDCNEHTQLYVAMARALGIPARVAAGLVYIDGKFYYHAWPEVWLREWVAVDPTTGQFPADAAHLRFVTGGLDRQAELLDLIGRLRIDVIQAGDTGK